MPHRIALAILPPDIYASVVFWCAGFVAFLNRKSGAIPMTIEDKNWERLIGPFGALLLAVTAAVILLRMYLSSVKTTRNDKAAQHAEMVTALNAQTAKTDHLVSRLMDLTAEGIVARGKTDMAIDRIDSTLKRFSEIQEDCASELKAAIGSRPCHALTLAEIQKTLPPMP